MPYVYRYPPGKKAGSLWLELEPPFALPKDSFFPHSHAFTELTLVLEGTGRHRVSGAVHATAPGEVIICQPGIAHAFIDSQGQVHRNLHFDPVLAAQLKAEAPEFNTLAALFPAQGPSARLRLSPKNLALAEQILREIEAEQRGLEPGRQAAMRLGLKRLLLFLGRALSNGAAPQEREREGLSKALAHLGKHYAQPLSLEQLAAVAQLSPSHFRRLFKRAFGDSPINYLIRQRVRASCAALEEGGTSISDIAYACGFPDSNYFSRQFRKVMGASPRQYRSLSSKSK